MLNEIKHALVLLLTVSLLLAPMACKELGIGNDDGPHDYNLMLRIVNGGAYVQNAEVCIEKIDRNTIPLPPAVGTTYCAQQFTDMDGEAVIYQVPFGLDEGYRIVITTLTGTYHVYDTQFCKGCWFNWDNGGEGDPFDYYTTIDLSLLTPIT